MKRVRGNIYLLSAFVLVAANALLIYRAPVAFAAQITNRKLTLIGVGTVGGSTPGGLVNHKFDFTLPTTGSGVGSMKFEYCTVAQLDACVAPTAMDATNAVYGPESGFTGFSMGTKTANSVIISRAVAANPPATPVSFQLNNVKNTTGINKTFYVRISTYASLNGTGTAIDTGSVAASTAQQIQLSGIMPESLIFCTGKTVPVIASTTTPDCANADLASISFNQLFSPSSTATATSQMAASTNAATGYVISVNGPTLTSGSNTIPAKATQALGTRGTSEFGMNLVANTVTTSPTPVGANPSPVRTLPDLRGQPTAGYATADQFQYVDGATVASSDGPSNGQIYTTSYIANVAGNQVSGTYSTTLTYICTPTF